ncbi:MAG: type I-C CRISPR-associated endonuclease Cas1c [Pseudomonadota bacterium]|nr:type I-C CRISPR-associated endonuclease Cas1c [Pseudomonadota bacterium]
MKKLLNNVYVDTQGSRLSKERETIVVKDGDSKIAQIPAINIANIFCFGSVTISSPLMGYCAESGINLVLLTTYGKFLARVHGKSAGNVLLRREQYRWADDEQRSLAVARLIVAAKITNTRTILQRELRNHGDNSAVGIAVNSLNASCQRLASTKRVNTINTVRGIEGDAASVYFSVFNDLLRVNDFVFNSRIKRSPTDPVNAMLSFAYTLLTSECASALAGVGLDPYVGFLHQDRPGRVSLALDLLEEFRALFADRLVLTLINRKQVSVDDFITEAGGAVRFKDRAKKRFLNFYQERKQQELVHPFLQEKITLGLLPHCQAMLLARHLRGDLEFYPPFIAR